MLSSKFDLFSLKLEVTDAVAFESVFSICHIYLTAQEMVLSNLSILEAYEFWGEFSWLYTATYCFREIVSGAFYYGSNTVIFLNLRIVLEFLGMFS